MFDPYLEWLGIPKHHRPVTLYQLLGVAPGETNPQTIQRAAAQQTARVQRFAAGPHANVAARLLQEIATAQAVLLDPARRAAYDRKLQQTHPTTAAPAGQAARASAPAPAAAMQAGEAGQPAGARIVPAVLRGVIPQAPGQAVGVADLAREIASASPLDPLQPRRRRSQGTLMLVLLGGGSLAAIVLVAVVWALVTRNRSGSGEPAAASAQTQTPAAPQAGTQAGTQVGTQAGTTVPSVHDILYPWNPKQKFQFEVLRTIAVGVDQQIFVSSTGNRVLVGSVLYDPRDTSGSNDTRLPIVTPKSSGFDPVLALSPGASLLAVAEQPFGEVVHVYDCRSGMDVLQVRRGDFFKSHAEFLAFLSDNELLIVWRDTGNYLIEVWDVAQRRKLWELPCGSKSPNAYLTSGDGSRLLVLDIDGIAIHDLRGRRVVGRTQVAADFLNVGSMAVSPVNEEFAVLSGSGSLEVYDHSGKSVLRVDLDVSPRVGRQKMLTWTEDGRGIMVGDQYLVHRGTGLVVWQIKNIVIPASVAYLGPDYLVQSTSPDRCEVLSSPWGRIRSSLAALESGAPAFVTPRRPVTVNVEVTEAVCDSPSSTAQAVLRRVTDRLAKLGLRTDANQPAVLHVVYREAKQVDELEVQTRRRPPKWQKIKVPVVVITLKMTWRGPQGRELCTYHDEVRVMAHDFISTPSAENVYSSLSSALQKLPIAAYIPEDPNLPTLPLYTIR